MHPNIKQEKFDMTTSYFRKLEYPLINSHRMMDCGDILLEISPGAHDITAKVVHSKNTEWLDFEKPVPTVFLEYWYATIYLKKGLPEINNSSIHLPRYTNDYKYDFDFPVMCNIYENKPRHNPISEKRLYLWLPEADESLDAIVFELKRAISMPLTDAIRSGRYIINEHFLNQE